MGAFNFNGSSGGNNYEHTDSWKNRQGRADQTVGIAQQNANTNSLRAQTDSDLVRNKLGSITQQSANNNPIGSSGGTLLGSVDPNKLGAQGINPQAPNQVGLNQTMPTQNIPGIQDTYNFDTQFNYDQPAQAVFGTIA